MSPDLIEKINSRLTKTERRLFNVLLDGEAHTPTELMEKAFGGDLVEIQTLRNHLCHIRNKIRMVDMDIVGQHRGKYSPVEYKLVFLVTSATIAKLGN
jgi:hypothetical protein